MRHFTITAHTMAQANPAHVGEGGNYRWRYKDFCALREAGVPVSEAAERLSVPPSMAAGYEAARLADLEAS